MELKIAKFGTRFSTRPKARVVFNDLDLEKSVVLDFGGVEAATPSFLHETLIILSEKGVEYSFTNMSNSIDFQYRKALKAID